MSSTSWFVLRRRCGGAFLLALLTLFCPPLARASERSPESATIALGDEQFAKRADGVLGSVGNCAWVDEAIRHYRAAAASSPQSLTALTRLLRALHFRGAFCEARRQKGTEEPPASKTRRLALFDEGRKLGQAAIDRLERQVEQSPTRAAGRIAFLKAVPDAGLLFVWTGALWGEWAQLSGKFAAAKAGIGSRLRDLAQTVIDIDPALQDAAGYRLLGRLHADAPKIPFFTGWVSREKGLAYLRRAHEIGPRHPITWYFLAEAILEHEPQKKMEAIALLEKCATTEPRPDTVIEDRRYAEMAKEKLQSLSAR